VPTGLKYPWSAYATLQAKASRLHRINDTVWGTDDGLAYILPRSKPAPSPLIPTSYTAACRQLQQPAHGTIATMAGFA
jgi:hypothetical protein